MATQVSFIDYRPENRDPKGTQSSDSILPIEAAVRHVRARRAKRIQISGALMASDIVALAVGFAIANYIVYRLEDIGQIVTLLSVSVPLFIGFGLHDGAYGARTGIRFKTSIFRALKALALVSVSLMLVAFFLKVGANFSRVQFVIGNLLASTLMCAFRKSIAQGVAGAVKNGLFAELHIYDGVVANVEQVDGERFVIDAREKGLIPDLGSSVAVNRLGTIARGMDSVVVYCRPEARLGWSNALRTLDVPTELVVPELDNLNAVKITTRDGHTAILLSDGRLTWDQVFLKRVFDLVLVIPLLPALCVLFAIVGVLIKLDSRGPVFFRQDRIGIGNRVFRIWKFRSMKVAEQDDSASKLTQRNDSRVTRFGAFIRKTSIDELPQLINVLIGDMSLVGPRPHAAMARAGSRLYWEVDTTYWERHVVKPGITGLAQVRGFRGNTFNEDNLRDRLQADLEYVANWNLWLDAKVLLGTVLVIFHKNAF